MADNETKPQTIFVLTGPREGFTGVLGGRYGFRNGKLTVNQEYKDKLKLILCNRYCCNVEGEKPVWTTKDGASVKIGEVSKPKPVVTSVTDVPKASLEVPIVEPKVEPPGLPTGPEPEPKPVEVTSKDD